MEFSTKPNDEQKLVEGLKGLKHYELVQRDWERLQEDIGIDLEQTARETKALQRKREIRSAGDLLRLILFYVLSGWGLRMTAAWAHLNEIGKMSDVAVLKRLRNSSAWIGKLVAVQLQNRCSALKTLPGVRLRICDATCISRGGLTEIEWRVHLGFDLVNMCVDSIQVTDRHGGETLTRFDPQSNEIFLADAGYAFASGLGPLFQAGAGLVVRINWRNVPLFSAEGERLDLIPWLKSIDRPTEQPVWLQTPQGWFPLRLIAAPIPPQKIEAARRKVYKRYQRKQRPLSEDTLLAAGFVLLLTNLPTEPWSSRLVLHLYRARWQIEILFKRLKSLLELDQSQAKDPRLSQTYLLSKLLLALLIDSLIHQVSLNYPDWFVAIDRPVNFSHLTSFFKESIRQVVIGLFVFHDLQTRLLFMQRYFCDPPRCRPQQFALFRALFQHLCISSPFPLS